MIATTWCKSAWRRGHEELQKAEFLGSHGRYAYYDTVKELGIQIELLEFNADMEKQP